MSFCILEWHQNYRRASGLCCSTVWLLHQERTTSVAQISAIKKQLRRRKLSAMTVVTMTFCSAFIYYLSLQEYLHVSFRISFQDFNCMTNRIWNSVLGVLTSLWTGRSRDRFSSRASDFSLPKVFQLFIQYFPEGGGGGRDSWGMRVTSYLSRMPWLRASGSVLFPWCVFMPRTKTEYF